MVVNIIAHNSLSFCAYKIDIYSKDGVFLAMGTCFFYEHEDIYYLVTNGHNITRVNPETNLRITNNPAVPHVFKINFRTNVKKGERDGIGSRSASFNLYSDDAQTSPCWLMHPTLGYMIDVVCIAMFKKNELGDLIIKAINRHPDLIDDYPLEVSDDVFVLGYPLNMTGGKDLPIWKKGSVATEPGVNINKLPKILIDTATRSGMSGAPVIFKRSGVHGLGTDGEDDGDSVIGTISGFVGVYSGRIGAEDNFQAQLGIVWKKSVIDEIILGEVLGSLDFQKA